MTWDYETKQKEERKKVDPKDLEEGLIALKEEAIMYEVNLKDLFITGSRGDVKGLLKEDVFKDNLAHEGIWLKTKELDSLINHFYDPRSGCIDC